MKKNSFFSNMPIKIKLICYYTFVVMISIVIFSAVVLIHSGSVVKQLAQKNVEEILNSAERQMVSLVNDINVSILSFQINETALKILSDDSMQNSVEDVNTLETELLSVDPFQTKINALELYSLKRTDFPNLNSYQRVFSSEQMKNDPLFNEMISSGYSTNWYIIENYNESLSYIIASKLICDVHTQEPLALLNAKIKMTTFTNIVDSLTLMDTGKVFLCSQTHLTNHSDSQLGQGLANNKILFNDMLLKEGKQFAYITIDGHKYYVSSHPVPETQLYIVGAVKISEFNAAQNSIMLAIFITTLVLIIFSLFFISFISSYITKPLLFMTQKMSDYQYNNGAQLPAETTDEIGMLFHSFNTMQDKITTLIEEIQKEIKIRRIAELKALQAQITPHFLYNTLNSICALAHKYKAADIEEMIMALSKFFQTSLNNGNEMITLRLEVEQALSYIYIQKIRYGDKFDVNIDLPKELEHYMICKLTLQPLVENCINHAFYGVTYPCRIDIVFKKVEDNIIITVADNGIGELAADPQELNEYINKKFDENEPIDKYSILNVNQRIRLYFGSDCGLHYESGAEGGFVVTIKIKAIKSDTDCLDS